MSGAELEWPRTKRELQNHHMDSTVWNDFAFRPDDIVIATYAKSGTTWTQQIVSQLVFNGAEKITVPDLSPWFDLRVPPNEMKLAAVESQTHRRFVKSHLPVDALVFSPQAKYLYIGHDGRDVMWSMYNHHANGSETLFEALNQTPGLVGPLFPERPTDVVKYFEEWLERDGYPLWSFWENVANWWEIRDLPNVKLLQFADMKADLGGKIREIAKFLEISLDDAQLSLIEEHCAFDYMRRHASEIAPGGGIFWNGGGETFIHKGTNGRWRDTLPEELSERYEEIAREKLGEECAAWLAHGSQN